MNRLLKYIFKLILGIGFLLLLLGFVISTFFSKKVENAVVKNIQKSLTSTLEFSGVGFTLFDNFPAASVKINDILILESDAFDNDTLFYAKESFIELDILDIISSKFDINKVVISEGQLNIKYNKDNVPNFNIFNSEKQEESKVNFEKLILLNTKIGYNNLSKNVDIYFDVNQLLANFNGNNIALNSKLFSDRIIVNNINYLEKKQLSLKAETKFAKDTITITAADLLVENVFLNVDGLITQGNRLNLNVSAKEQDISSLIKHMPKTYQKVCSSFIASGMLNSDCSIVGLVASGVNPKFKMNYSISKGNFKLKQLPFVLKNISTNGIVDNGSASNFNTTYITANAFKANTENGYLKGELTFKNLNNYFLETKLKSEWDLAEINHYFEDSPFFNLQGILVANTTYKGRIDFDKKFKNHFLNAKHYSDVIIKNASFNYKNFPLAFGLQTADCTFKNNIITVKSSTTTIADSDLNFEGDITDLIPYILDKKDKIKIDGALQSTYIKFDELITLKNLSEEESTTTMPTWIAAQLNTNIETFTYNDFISNTISGSLNYNKQELRGKNMQLDALNGSISGDFKFYESPTNNMKLFSSLILKKLNIRNAFLAFEDFSQNFITAEHIKGIGSAEIQMQAAWGPGFIFDEKQLNVKSHLIIEKGELIQFKPLESLSDYVSLEDLKNVKFSTLENTIEIENEVITIPTMEIKSTALSVFLSGTHNFKHEIDYRIKLLLSELMSTKFRKKNTNIDNEFGAIEKNDANFTTIYLKMEGDTDDPKVSFDGFRIREDVKKGIKKEKEIIGTIIKEDILQTQEQEKEEKGQDVSIEWDDE